ncbi:heavy metal translocating P-type ATPase [Verticiella sediminum]|uniref:Heavy metal translocating P-type ATPase n=1 Tax=Verticiella sediminum TaxID=1247510 RepID=A0A556AIW6_9BURK|nr:heavy metal translocating P-type ATPase [Verticiella sediminum]TSH92819.1 heavy metal translocating P-type ATPase [Verticiella sediminum]
MTEKLRLDIPLVLPDVDSAADRCVSRLTAELVGRDGVESAHVVPADDGGAAQLCVHYDPAVLPLPRIRELVRAAGAQITQRYGHALWRLDIPHQRRADTIAERLRELPGVLEAQASASGLVRVEFDRARIDPIGLRGYLQTLQPGGHVAAVYETDELPAPAPAAQAGAGVAARPHHHDHDHHDHGVPGDAREPADEAGATPAGAVVRDTSHAQPHSHVHGHGHGLRLFGRNSELVFSLACGALLGLGLLLRQIWPDAGAWALACFVAAYVFGGFFTLAEALDNLRLRRFEIDTLMLVAAAGAAALGAWAEGALLLFLFSLGHALEHYAMGRAERAIRSLAELAPDSALVRRGEQWRETPVQALVPGDVVLVKADARLPADGFVVRGESAVNQAPVTGESVPVDKRPVADPAEARAQPARLDEANRVFAGTINGSGTLEVEVSRRADDSTLARLVRLVSEAETQKSPTQRFTDRFERVFVPAVLALVVLLLFAWVVVDEPFRDSFYRAMAVLVAASPCALAIATPSAVLSGVARAARGGVLVKGGGPLENLGSVDAIAFDKTGTLTIGRPRITDVAPAPGVDAQALLAVAVAVERLSDHPLARAIARDGAGRLAAPAPSAEALESLTGRGVRARIGEDTVWIGKAAMFGEGGLAPLDPAVHREAERLAAAGRTTMVVRRGASDLGVIALMDTARPEARAALSRLRALGVRRLAMISGDNPTVADAVARELGLDQALGGLLPDDKVEAIRRLRRQGKVAMVGDGVNDAPAMAHATVGVAMGAAGSDVALETADVALMADDLSALPFAVALSRRTRAVILQNVCISLGVVAFLVPATILGLGIGPAVALHEGTTLVVVANALRLLAWRDRAAAPAVGAVARAGA